MDLLNSLTTVKLVAGLGLERIQNKPWHIRATNAITGEGLQIAIEWLTEQIQDIYINKRYFDYLIIKFYLYKFQNCARLICTLALTRI